MSDVHKATLLEIFLLKTERKTDPFGASIFSRQAPLHHLEDWRYSILLPIFSFKVSSEQLFTKFGFMALLTALRIQDTEAKYGIILKTFFSLIIPIFEASSPKRDKYKFS